MNRDELLRECIEAENFGLDNPGFTVAVKGLYTAKKVKIDRDLYAENLGHYPDGFSDVMTHTHLFIRCSDVRQHFHLIKLEEIGQWTSKNVLNC